MIRTGYTLIELMIAITIFVIASVVIGGFGVGLYITWFGPTQAEVEADARAWATDMGLEPKGVSCVLRDTDGDGYISCNVNAGGRVHSIECAAGIGPWANTGCRTSKVLINDRHQP